MATRENFLADRAARDAALALFKADIQHLRNDLAAKGIGARIGERLGEGAVDMADEALELAGENKGKVGAGVAALILWIFHRPLFSWLFGEDAPEDDEYPEEPEHSRWTARWKDKG